MANVDFNVNNESYIIDTSATPITGGSKIYLRANSVTYPFVNVLSSRDKILVDPAVDAGESVAENWDRRTGSISYQGFARPTITVKGVIDLDSTGSFATNQQLATIGRLWKLWNTPDNMPYYFWDSKIGSALVKDGNDYDPTIGDIHSIGSIPIAIKNVTFVWNKPSLNKITYTMILWED